MDLKRICVVRTDRIGDVMLTTPVFKALRQAFPRAHIAALVSSSNKELVEGNPYLDSILVDDRNGKHKGFIGFLQLARDIRRENFDTAIVFHTKRRTNMACFLAGIAQRIGYHNDKWGFLLTHPIKDVRHLGQEHEARLCLDCLKVLGIKAQAMEPQLTVSSQNQQWVRNWLSQHDAKPGEIIVIHPSASDPTKCWPAASFASMIDSLAQRYRYKIIVMGDAATASIVKEIKSRTTVSIIDAVGALTLGQMAALLQDASVLISNDSGPVHVASAVATPVISIFTRLDPGINPKRWAPLGDKSYLLMPDPKDAIRLNAKGEIASGRLDAVRVESVLETVEAIFQKETQATFIW